ncbi:MAG: hypothetical protein U0694_04040 [Anaerolineae bacterium]
MVVILGTIGAQTIFDVAVEGARNLLPGLTIFWGMIAGAQLLRPYFSQQRMSSKVVVQRK